MRVHVAGEQGAAPHRLPDFRLRHPIGFHRPRHDEPDGALARGVRPYWRAAHLGLAQVPRHSRDWFVPGFTIESHPRACEALLPDGHEVAHHSWAHIPPAQQTRAEEEADLVRAN